MEPLYLKRLTFDGLNVETVLFRRHGMQVSISYLDWERFSELAGDDFEDNYYAQWETGDGVQGVLSIQEEDDPGDSFQAWDAATEILADCVNLEWRRFFDECFFSRASSPRNDLGCSYSPDMLSATISNETVAVIMTPIQDQPFPVDESNYDKKVTDQHKEIFQSYDEFIEYVKSWLSIWSKAFRQGHGICYHIG